MDEPKEVKQVEQLNQESQAAEEDNLRTEQVIAQQEKEERQRRNIRIIESDIWRMEQMIVQGNKKREELLKTREQMIVELNKAVPKEEDSTKAK